MNIIILISTVSLVNCQIQNENPSTVSAVQIDRVEVQEIKPIDINKNDQAVLKVAKVEDVNKTEKYISESQVADKEDSTNLVSERSTYNKQMRITPDIFSNPILEYLLHGNKKENEYGTLLGSTKYEENQDAVVGQYIKRKVTHQQTLVLPMSEEVYILDIPFDSSNLLHSNVDEQTQNALKHALENQTVENIKGIVNQKASLPVILNSYPYKQVSSTAGLHSNSYRTNGLNAKIPNGVLFQQSWKPSKQWQWPLAQYFPIVIKDPLQQIFNAFTTMVEYGPPPSPGSDEAQCAKTEANHKIDLNDRDGKTLKDNAETVLSREPIHQNKPAKQIDLSNVEIQHFNTPLLTSINSNSNPEIYSPPELWYKTLPIAFVNVETTTNYERDVSAPFLKLTPINLRRSKKKKNEVSNSNNDHNYKRPSSLGLSSLQVQDRGKFGLFKPTDGNRLDSSSSNENTKILSNDNTGGGIYVHRIKVSKGGLAIAGPGGIATAGSGGTAIVGPNGYVYSHPDSLAIAGSGTKVIAVEPNVDLTHVIDNIKKNGIAVNPRHGKIVAIGPIIYYNKG